MTREEAIQILRTRIVPTRNWQEIHEALDMAIEALTDRPQGEWKHTITWQPYCSNCEYVFGEDEEFSPFWNYCPMCGARMKDSEAETISKERFIRSVFESAQQFISADRPITSGYIADDKEVPPYTTTSADTEPKWNCTANFVAEQLDRLRNMTDEERLDFLKRFFSPSADRPHGEWIAHATSVGDKKYIEYSRCSECGEMALVRMNYCPNCGADMTPKGFTADEWYRNTFKGGDAE